MWLEGRNIFEQRPEIRFRRKQNGKLDPFMRAGVARMVQPELGDAELTGAYNGVVISALLQSYSIRFLWEKAVAVPHWSPRCKIEKLSHENTEGMSRERLYHSLRPLWLEWCGTKVVSAMIVRSELGNFLLLARVNQANHATRVVTVFWQNNTTKECLSPTTSYCQPTPLTHGAEDHRYPLCTMVASSRPM